MFGRAILMVSVLVGSWAGTARANDFVARYLKGTEVCFGRVYDAAHMNRHPRQTVTRISLIHPNPYAESRELQLGLALQLKEKAGWYGGISLRCDPFGTSTLSCGVEGDGGTLAIDAVGLNSVRLRLARLQLEGEQDFSGDIAAEPDNRVMMLRRLPRQACPRPPS